MMGRKDHQLMEWRRWLGAASVGAGRRRLFVLGLWLGSTTQWAVGIDLGMVAVALAAWAGTEAAGRKTTGARASAFANVCCWLLRCWRAGRRRGG